MSIAKGLFLFILLIPSLAYGRCRAEAEITNFWEEKDGFVMKANVTVNVTDPGDGGYVTVYVKPRFHWSRNDDDFSSHEDTIKSVMIDTNKTDTKQFVIDARESMCGDDHPCTINDVSVTEVTCHE